MKLSNFESVIDRKIYARGKAYYDEGTVTELEEQSPGRWTAVVEGSYENWYDVFFDIRGNEIVNWGCNCPYTMGPVCKHVVAALLEYRATAGTSAGEEESPAPKAAEQVPKADTAEGLLALFKNLSDQEQRAVKIASLVYRSFTINNFVDIFNRANFRWDGGSISLQQAGKALRLLAEQGFLNRRGDVFEVHTGFAHELCERFFERDADFRKVAAVVGEVLRANYWFYRYEPGDFFRDMRLARYLNKVEVFRTNYFNLVNAHGNRYTQEKLIAYWFSDRFDQEKVEALPPDIRAFLLSEKFLVQLLHLNEVDDFFAYAAQHIASIQGADVPRVMRYVASLFLLRGDWPGLERVIPFVEPVDREWLLGARLLLQGNAASAVEAFDNATKMLRRETRNRHEALNNLAGIFQMLAQLKTQDPVWLPRIEKHLQRLEKAWTSFRPAFEWLEAVLYFLRNDKPRAEQRLQGETPSLFLMRFFRFFCQFWVDRQLVKPSELAAYIETVSGRGYDWLELELQALQDEIQSAPDAQRNKTQEQLRALGIAEPLFRLLPRIEAWENALNALLLLGRQAERKGRAGESRLVWLVDFKRRRIQAREQSLGKNGWTKGRPVAFDRLLSGGVDCLTEQDRRVVDEIAFADGSEIYVQEEKVWKRLAGHPLLFLWESPQTALQLLEGKLSLIVRADGTGYRVSLSHPVEQAGLQVVRETPTRYLLIDVDERMYEIARALNRETLLIPERGAEQLKEAVAGLSGLLDVQSVFEDENLPSVAPDDRLHVHLLPVGDGFHVELYVKPFRDAPPYVRPGEGEPILIAVLDGRRTTTTRDLKAEKEAVKQLLDRAPVLQAFRPQKGVWELEEAKQCLDLLLQLDPLVQSEEIVLEWPKGEKLRITNVVSADQLRLDIRGRGHWFEVSGELRVDEEQVLSMQELLQLSEAQGQFIELSPGRFLALTEEFRRRLQEANAFIAPQKKGGALQLHPLAAPALEGFLSELKHLQTDKAFRESRRRLEAAFAQTFTPPMNFLAELRPYQRDGYEWLQRCAAWGVGACLADDMGLGKTIQALAVLTDRAQLGPALVVAPASVCRNWRAETASFAPALQPMLFGEGDRAAMIEAAGPGDLLIVTYDLMARESENFSQKQFATVILDEAQAIKNRATKRSDAAMQLQADFKMILTGTPLENHLGELWNLFQFINPGLLGPIDQFNDRFTLPIEKYQDEEKREQLRRLVRPFILRRRKDEVLKELPEKTEVTLIVELPPEERAFYEALRRNALEKLTADTGARAGEQHLRILAELMRLRRAACHPQLVDANAGFSSSAKLRLFGEIVEELLDNGHKALVFSQFVGHLKILETYLKEKNITYQYLDGQTPLARRQERIEAFQKGQGDIFLISLKAGGVGLNLTAADYVIHTDPWWNPAVEDQATDRAHRIGQEKPVTVYRLVVENTIEEKILALHEQKRDLADSLLAGTDVSAKMTAEELLALLRD